MAKLALTLIPTLALFLLFSLSHSLPQSDLDGQDVLLLPSDKPSDVPDITHSTAAVSDPKPTIAETETETKPEGFATVPLTKLDFHQGMIPLSLRFPNRRRFGRGCRHGFMRRPGMRPRAIPYGNDMILPEEFDRPEKFVGGARFHWVNRRPRFEVAAPWKGEEDVFERPKRFERDHEEEDLSKRLKKFGHHDDDEDMFKRPMKFDHDHDHDDDRMFETVEKIKRRDDDDDRMLETVEKIKRRDDDDDRMFRMPRKFKHDDDDDDWHREKHHHGRRHHHKHHHDDDDDEDDEKGGILSKMSKFFDDLF